MSQPLDRQPDTKSSSWPALAIAIALLGWGIYLAIGAATHESQDLRKAAVILGCSIVFVAFWLFYFFRMPRGAPADASDSWNLACVSSFVASLIANGLVWAATFGGAQSTDQVRARFLLAAIACGGLTGLLTVIGLSHPTKSRGKSWAFLAMLLLVGAIAIVVLAVSQAGQA